METSPEKIIRRRMPIRICIYLLWLGFGLFAVVGTLFFYAWQGFSPDGPPPGFKPEPIVWFFLKNFPLMFLGMAIHFWGISLPLLAVTLLEIWRTRSLRPRKPGAYDLP